MLIGLIIATFSHDELLKLPKVQNKIACNFCSSEKYCIRETKEAKKADTITPAKTNKIVLLRENSFETNNTDNTAIIPNANADDGRNKKL